MQYEAASLDVLGVGLHVFPDVRVLRHEGAAMLAAGGGSRSVRCCGSPRRSRRVGRDVDAGDVRAELGEPDRHPGADASGGPGDERGGTVEPEGRSGHVEVPRASRSAWCLAVQALIASHCFSASGSRTLRVHASFAFSLRVVPLKCGTTWLANRW